MRTAQSTTGVVVLPSLPGETQDGARARPCSHGTPFPKLPRGGRAVCFGPGAAQGLLGNVVFLMVLEAEVSVARWPCTVSVQSVMVKVLRVYSNFGGS